MQVYIYIIYIVFGVLMLLEHCAVSLGNLCQLSD